MQRSGDISELTRVTCECSWWRHYLKEDMCCELAGADTDSMFYNLSSTVLSGPNPQSKCVHMEVKRERFNRYWCGKCDRNSLCIRTAELGPTWPDSYCIQTKTRIHAIQVVTTHTHTHPVSKCPPVYRHVVIAQQQQSKLSHRRRDWTHNLFLDHISKRS